MLELQHSWGLQALFDQLASLKQTGDGASLLWVSATGLAYALSLWLYRQGRAHPLLLPVLTGTLMVMAVLHWSGTAYADYFRAVEPLRFLIGPATVALAIPLFGQWKRLKPMAQALAVALAVGSLVAIGSSLLIAWALGGKASTLIALAPKAATMPIATQLTERVGGITALAAVAVALTGISGSMLSGLLLGRGKKPFDEVCYGFALGLGAHAIGTARAMQISATAGAFAALAMGLNGLLTAVLMPAALLLASWLGGLP
jgi:putative effector of murein hydrolase